MNVRFRALSAHKSLCRWRSLPPFAEREIMEYWIETAASVCLDAEGTDEFAPLLRFVGDEFTELGR